MVSRRLRVASTAIVAVLGASLLLGSSFGGPARAADSAGTTAAADAVAWIVSQQQTTGALAGSFEVAGFAGFETPDAVLAIAVQAQTGSAWSSAEARTAVSALEAGGSGGPTPIDWLDDWVTVGVNAGEASKLLVLVVAPLGLDPEHFGPSDHDLAAAVYPGGCASPPDTSGLFFTERMFVALGGQVLCGGPDPAVIASIRAAQHPGGGWNFNASLDPVDPSDPFDPDAPDIDTTALAVQALVAGGASWDDPGITRALAYLAAHQSASGAFPSFGSDDPNATSVAMLAIAAAGFDPTGSCWRDTAVPAAKGTAYVAPAAWLRSQQQADGHVASPNDGFGVNTFATAQSVQALLRGWVPVARAAGAPTCVVVAPAIEEQTPPDPVQLVPRFTG